MKGKIAAIVCLLVTAVWGMAEEAPLPEWKGIERGVFEFTGGIAGLVLLSDYPVPGQQEISEVVVDFPMEAESPEGEKEESYINVADEFLPAYFAERPPSFLLDPQGLLSSIDNTERLNFLNYHAGDSAVDLFVYVFGADQQIPSEVRHEELMERHFSEGRPAAVLFYFWGASERSMLQLSPALLESVSSGEQYRAVESAAIPAREKSNPAEQFEKFLVQMSIRVYWMERGHTEAAGEDHLIVARPVAAKQSKLSAANAEKLERLREWSIAWWKPVVGGFAGLGGFYGLILWLRSRARYTFPDLNVEPRLGGAHGAGIGAVISFARGGVSPSLQRNQAPAYLRRN